MLGVLVVVCLRVSESELASDNRHLSSSPYLLTHCPALVCSALSARFSSAGGHISRHKRTPTCRLVSPIGFVSFQWVPVVACD